MLRSTLLVIGAVTTHTLAAQAPPPLPLWFSEELRQRVTGDSIAWVTDNRQWTSAQEPAQAYGMRWWATPGGRGMRGVLFAIVDGRESAPIWEFRTFWHPGRQAVMVVQYNGWGGYAEGVLKPSGTRAQLLLEQESWDAGGTRVLARHESEYVDGRQVDTQFTMVEGRWERGRQYVWEKRSLPLRSRS